jgi:hypothetical protein
VFRPYYYVSKAGRFQSFYRFGYWRATEVWKEPELVLGAGLARLGSLWWMRRFADHTVARSAGALFANRGALAHDT